MNQSNWHKLIQAGAPMKGLAPDFNLERVVKNLEYTRISTGKEIVISKKTQLEIWDELLDFTPSDTESPIICISAPGHDRLPIRQAVELMSHFLDKDLKVKWHILGSGYRYKSELVFNTDVLFISNVVSTSTQHRLELLRDVVSMNHRSLRVIITAGWNAMELAQSTSISLNGLVHLGELRK